MTENKQYIANKDIIGYKWTHSYEIKRDLFKSFFQDFVYVRGKKAAEVELLPMKKLPYERISASVINKGYHTLKLKKDISKSLNRRRDNGAIFIIPKGSAYYENDTERVSSSLIYAGPFTLWNCFRVKYLKKYK